jgi:leucyl aminopeptidase
MTVPTLLVSSLPPLDIVADVLVLGVQKTDSGPRLLTTAVEFDSVAQSLPAIGVTGGLDELTRIPSPSGAARSIALIGVGPALGPNELRYASGSAARQLRGIDSLAIALPIENTDDLLGVLEGVGIGAYSYTPYRSSSLESTKLPASLIAVVTELADAESVISTATATVLAMKTVRDLVNAPPSDLYPETFANEAVALAADLPIEVTVLTEAELASGGFGGILGVGQGSSRGPRLVKVSYSPASAKRHLALVGKGITFDSGGLSLKPAASMVGMKYDMTGAATVLAVTIAAAQRALPVRITAWLCLAENLPSGTATRPNDVLRIRGGKTVEVLNTDAEGRLVLADGLVAASEENPDAIIDVATLTGAARVALGNRYSAVMGDDDLVAQLIAAASRVGESMWAMPLPPELRSLLNSDVADIANAKIGDTAAGMLIAGVFLKEFVGTMGEGDQKRSIPWAHLDIAGPANNGGGAWGFTAKGPTAVTVRALLALAEEFSVA